MYPEPNIRTSMSITGSSQPQSKRSELVSNALDQNNQVLTDSINRLEGSLSRLGYNFTEKPKTTDGPRAVPSGAFGTFEDKIQTTSSLLARLQDLCTIFEGFV